MIRKTLASIVLAAGLSAFAQTAPIQLNIYGNEPDPSNSIIVPGGDGYVIPLEIYPKKPEPSKMSLGDSVRLSESSVYSELKSQNPNYNLVISIAKDAISRVNLTPKPAVQMTDSDYKILDYSVQLLSGLGTAYNKTGQQQKTIDEILPVLGSIELYFLATQQQ